MKVIGRVLITFSDAPLPEVKFEGDIMPNDITTAIIQLRREYGLSYMKAKQKAEGKAIFVEETKKVEEPKKEAVK